MIPVRPVSCLLTITKNFISLKDAKEQSFSSCPNNLCPPRTDKIFFIGLGSNDREIEMCLFIHYNLQLEKINVL